MIFEGVSLFQRHNSQSFLAGLGIPSHHPDHVPRSRPKSGICDGSAAARRMENCPVAGAKCTRDAYTVQCRITGHCAPTTYDLIHKTVYWVLSVFLVDTVFIADGWRRAAKRCLCRKSRPRRGFRLDGILIATVNRINSAFGDWGDPAAIVEAKYMFLFVRPVRSLWGKLNGFGWSGRTQFVICLGD